MSGGKVEENGKEKEKKEKEKRLRKTGSKKGLYMDERRV